LIDVDWFAHDPEAAVRLHPLFPNGQRAGHDDDVGPACELHHLDGVDHMPAIQPREEHVEQDQIRWLVGAEEVEGGCAVGEQRRFVTFGAHDDAEPFAFHRIVFHDQDVGLGHWLVTDGQAA